MPMKPKTKLVKVLLTNIMIAFAISLVASYIAIGQAAGNPSRQAKMTAKSDRLKKLPNQTG